jgi:AraC-like DNA-binding protein/mannose-6-phosphate isomerase-like protein (cupin superfamily)
MFHARQLRSQLLKAVKQVSQVILNAAYWVAATSRSDYKSQVQHFPFNVERTALKPIETGWSYRRPELDGIVEMVTHRGSDMGLVAHFHNEDQIVFAVAGRRRFLIEGKIITLLPGHGIVIPARVLHQSLSEETDVECLNIFVPAGECAVAAMMHDAERQWHKAGYLRCTELAAIVCAYRQSFDRSTKVSDVIAFDPACPEPMSQAAARAGMSRGGYYRRFARHHGMPPHAYSLITRLNHARELLRAGDDIAGVAANAGFIDQSHLGRWFRNTFGITPGRYRSSFLQSRP